MKSLRAILLSLAFISCAGQNVVLTPYGTRSVLTQIDNSEMAVELLAFRDSNLVVKAATVRMIPFSSILRIQLEGGENSRGWLLPVAFFQGVPTALILALADDRTIGLIGLAITTVTVLCFEVSEPQRTFTFPLKPGEMETLRLHLRYPHGLSEDQFRQLTASTR